MNRKYRFNLHYLFVFFSSTFPSRKWITCTQIWNFFNWTVENDFIWIRFNFIESSSHFILKWSVLISSKPPIATVIFFIYYNIIYISIIFNYEIPLADSAYFSTYKFISEIQNHVYHILLIMNSSPNCYFYLFIHLTSVSFNNIFTFTLVWKLV